MTDAAMTDARSLLAALVERHFLRLDDEEREIICLCNAHLDARAFLATPAPSEAGMREALAELSFAAGRIHAGGTQDDLDRFEQAMIGAGMALRRTALALPPAALPSQERAGLDVERLARIYTRVRNAHNDNGTGRPDDEPDAPPCDWCRLAAQQHIEAAAAYQRDGQP